MSFNLILETKKEQESDGREGGGEESPGVETGVGKVLQVQSAHQ